MKLLIKLAFPQILIVICLGLISYKAIHDYFTGIHEIYVKDIVFKTFTRIEKDVEDAGNRGVSESSIFAKLPVAFNAFEMAAKGNMDVDDSPEAQAAREYLRKELAHVLSSHEELSGSKLLLHYHLPTGRSLARLWRDKQTKINGEWVDISDDLRVFRPTVLDAYKEGKPMKGIEVGSGGFVVRGVVPVITPAGKKLGTVEVLQDFEGILASAEMEERMQLILYLNEELLPYATALQNPAQNPKLGDLIRVTQKVDVETERFITPALLEAGKKETVFVKNGPLTLATFPIRDYRQKQIGVLVAAVKTNTMTALVRKADTTLMATLSGMAVIPIIVLLFVLGFLVSNPLNVIKRKIIDITEDRADLAEKMGSKQKDEIGDLARAFDILMAKINTIMNEMKAYVGMLHTVPDPIFAVDENFRMIMANKATLDFLGIDYQAMRSSYCYNQFRTKVCGTDQCPIEVVKRTGRQFELESIEICKNDHCMRIKPFADTLRDARGNPVGYVEVARAVMVENPVVDCDEQVEHLLKVNEATCEITRQLISSAKEKADEGAAVVKKTGESVKLVHEQAEQLKNTMYQVVSEVDGVRPQLDRIFDFAEQTRLLAINVAEASQAQDASTAFSGVADEVRDMAEQIVAAAEKAIDAVVSILQNVQETTHLADSAGDSSENAVMQAAQSYATLQGILEIFNASSGLIKGISDAVEQHTGQNGQNGQDGQNGKID